MKLPSRYAPLSLSAVVTLFVIVTAGCAGRNPTGPDPQTVAAVDVSPGSDTLLALGITQQFSATAKNSSGGVVTGKTFTWTSSAPGIVSVNPVSGLATAVTRGEAIISASVDGKAGAAAVLVTQEVVTVEVTPPTAGIPAIGATQQFTAVAKDANGAVVTGVSFLWISSDNTVATIDNTGKATAKAGGAATIIAAGLGVPGSASLTVTQVITQLAFSSQPANATEGLPQSGAVQVEIRDGNGALVANARNAITLAIGTNPSGGTLGGTLTTNAVGGIATFNGLSIDRAGAGYTLTATATGVGSATSGAFNIFLRFASVSAGFGYTCALTVSGDAWCWGRNFAGQLGDGTVGTNRLLPVKVLVPAGVRFESISASAGGNTTCALSTTGSSYCWGLGNGGELGNGINVNVATPVLTVPPAGIAFTTVRSAQNHACAISIAGVAYCWGGNVNHQLGDGTTAGHNLPLPVTMPAGQTFATISAAGGSGCGTTPLGVGYCWGAAVGDGTALERAVPTLVSAPGISFSTVTAGGGIACGLEFTGVARCWGDNTDGAVGDGTLVTRLAPVPVIMPGGNTFTQLGVSAAHVCAVAVAGTAYCWGLGLFGSLGNGATADVLVPTQVTMPPGVTFTSISAGLLHTCAVTSLGALYCWGQNATGQVGDGTQFQRNAPVRVQR